MADPPAIVILSEKEGRDPRPIAVPARATGDGETIAESFRFNEARVRATMRRDGHRVLVEVEDGKDAVDAPHWHRLDNRESVVEVRGAYDVLERLLVEWYDRAITAENRAAVAEARAAKAEQAHAKCRSVPALTMPAQDTAAARKKVTQLIELATGSTSIEEQRTAAHVAVNLIRDSGLTLK